MAQTILKAETKSILHLLIIQSKYISKRQFQCENSEVRRRQQRYTFV